MTPAARNTTAVAIFSSAIFFGQRAGAATGSLLIDRLGATPLFLGSAVGLPAWFASELRRQHTLK